MAVVVAVAESLLELMMAEEFLLLIASMDEACVLNKTCVSGGNSSLRHIVCLGNRV